MKEACCGCPLMVVDQMSEGAVGQMRLAAASLQHSSVNRCCSWFLNGVTCVGVLQ